MPALSVAERAISAHMNGWTEEARRHYVAAIRTGENTVELFRCYAWLLHAVGEKEKAKATWLRARKHEAAGTPNSPGRTDGAGIDHGLFLKETSAATDLALRYYDEGEAARAIKLAREAVRLNPADDLAHELIIRLLGESGRVEEAVDFYRQAPESRRRSFFVCREMGRILAASGRFEESVRIRNNGLQIPRHKLENITGHARLPASVSCMINHEGAEPHPEVRRLDIRAACDPSPTYVALRDATVLAGEWYIVSGNGAVFTDLNHGTPTGDPTPYYQDPANKLPSARPHAALPEPAHPKIDKAILIGSDPNYFRWVVDILPKLLALSRTPAFDDYPILVHEELAPYQLQGLALANIDPARLLKLEYPGCYPCGELIVPLFPPEKAEMAWSRSRGPAIRWLRRLVDPAARRRRRIYISRQDSKRRKIVNEEVLIDALRREGFEILVMSDYPQIDQIRIFSEADIVVAGHGAGLGNIAFAPEGCRIIEIQDPAWHTQQFQALAALGGQSLDILTCRSFLAERKLPINTDSYITDRTLARVLARVRDAGSATRKTPFRASPRSGPVARSR